MEKVKQEDGGGVVGCLCFAGGVFGALGTQRSLASPSREEEDTLPICVGLTGVLSGVGLTERSTSSGDGGEAVDGAAEVRSKEPRQGYRPAVAAERSTIATAVTEAVVRERGGGARAASSGAQSGGAGAQDVPTVEKEEEAS
ncbi:hypothetical protein Syun_012300 [Stephania yunnanensis]|uniref:Uncharacterized protein n=1 Tax=Stephania yunnanensis TaxID=152371 RepID=A0AAP0PIW0_9MAGN